MDVDRTIASTYPIPMVGTPTWFVTSFAASSESAVRNSPTAPTFSSATAASIISCAWKRVSLDIGVEGRERRRREEEGRKEEEELTLESVIPSPSWSVSAWLLRCGVSPT